MRTKTEKKRKRFAPMPNLSFAEMAIRVMRLRRDYIVVPRRFSRPRNAKEYIEHVRRITILMRAMDLLRYLNEHQVMAQMLEGATHRELGVLHSELMKLHDLFQTMSRQSSDAGLVASAEYDEPTKKRGG